MEILGVHRLNPRLPENQRACKAYNNVLRARHPRDIIDAAQEWNTHCITPEQSEILLNLEKTGAYLDILSEIIYQLSKDDMERRELLVHSGHATFSFGDKAIADFWTNFQFRIGGQGPGDRNFGWFSVCLAHARARIMTETMTNSRFKEPYVMEEYPRPQSRVVRRAF